MAFLFLVRRLQEVERNDWKKRVIRISEISESADSVTLRVEGRIVFEWVATLQEHCLQWLQGKREVLLDFSGVTYIDLHGVAMLKRMVSSNLRLINCPALITELLNGNGSHGEDS